MKDFKTLMKMVRQVYQILNTNQRVQMIGVFCALLIGSLFELLGVSSMMPFVESIMEPEKLYKISYIQTLCKLINIEDSKGVIVIVGCGIIFVYFVKNVFLAFSAYVQSRYNGRIKRDIAILMLRSYMQRPYSFFVETSMDTIMRGVQNDSDCVAAVIQSGFKLLSEFLVIAVVSAFLMTTDFTLTVGILAVGALCMVIVVLGLKKLISKMSSLMFAAAGRQYKSIYQIAAGIKEIMVYKRQRYFIKSFEDAADDSCTSTSSFNFVSVLPERVIETFCVSGIVIAVLIRVFMGIETVSFVSKLAVFAMGAFRLLPSISRSTGYINQFVYYREWVDVAYDNIMIARRITPEKRRYYWELPPDPNDDKDFSTNVELDNVCWRYPQSSHDVIKDLSFEFCKGQTIGIIGESGSGKSTLSDILLGLYNPQNGEVRMDGIDINTIPYSWSKNIGYVPQTVYLIDDTVRENVVFGAGYSDDERVWESLRKASLSEYVKSLPEGLDTVVGERGVKLSGGQRQRVAIARALYSDPQILILDEATAALDTETETAVMEEINMLAGTMTMIIIAHRVSTLKNCDKIFEIIDGRAIERDKDSVLKQS